MDIYQTEEQQVEVIKKFWQNNKRFILLAALLFTLGFFGVKYFKHHQEVVFEKDSLEFARLLNLVQDKDYDSLTNYGDTLQKKYKDTPYAELASLELAKAFVENNNLKAAEEQLLWVINKNKKGPLYHIAVVRLARLYRSNGEQDKALQLLNTNPNGFSALYDEIKGDIYKDKNDLNAAKKLYKQAMQAAPQSGATPWLQLKLEDIADQNVTKDATKYTTKDAKNDTKQDANSTKTTTTTTNTRAETTDKQSFTEQSGVNEGSVDNSKQSSVNLVDPVNEEAVQKSPAEQGLAEDQDSAEQHG